MSAWAVGPPPTVAAPPRKPWPAKPASTRQSGKTRIVAFRWAADKQLRAAVCDLANDTRHTNPWAANLYQQARTRGHKHPHAVRILARAWLTIIWKCSTTNTPYNLHQHRALQRLLEQG